MSEPIVCEICGKNFKSTQGLAGHLALKHGVPTGAKKQPRGGGVDDRFSELENFTNLRYKLVMARYLELEISRLERELSGSALSTQPSMQKPNVVVIPHQQQQNQRLCPACGSDIPDNYSPRRQAEQNLRNGFLVGYPCPNYGVGLYPSS